MTTLSTAHTRWDRSGGSHPTSTPLGDAVPSIQGTDPTVLACPHSRTDHMSQVGAALQSALDSYSGPGAVAQASSVATRVARLRRAIRSGNASFSVNLRTGLLTRHSDVVGDIDSLRTRDSRPTQWVKEGQ